MAARRLHGCVMLLFGLLLFTLWKTLPNEPEEPVSQALKNTQAMIGIPWKPGAQLMPLSWHVRSSLSSPVAWTLTLHLILGKTNR
eukprot:5979071-Amphidinium_carterae.1